MTETADPDGPIFVLRASPPRRVMGAGMLGILGVLLIWLAFTTATSVAWGGVLVLVGAASLALAVRLWQATAGALLLTAAGLTDEAGRVLAPIEEIVSVDRGAFAFKPSNGFLLRLTGSGARGWAPGLWWRMGRRMGVGGVTSAAQAKAMAEILSLQVSGRLAEPDPKNGGNG